MQQDNQETNMAKTIKIKEPKVPKKPSLAANIKKGFTPSKAKRRGK